MHRWGPGPSETSASISKGDVDVNDAMHGLGSWACVGAVGEGRAYVHAGGWAGVHARGGVPAHEGGWCACMGTG